MPGGLKVEVEKLTKRLEEAAGKAAAVQRELEESRCSSQALQARLEAVESEMAARQQKHVLASQEAAALVEDARRLSAAESTARAALELRVQELEGQVEQLRPSTDPGTFELATLRRPQIGLAGLRIVLCIPPSARTATFLRVYAQPRDWLAGRGEFAVNNTDRARHGNSEEVGAAFVSFLESRLNGLASQPGSSEAGSQWLKEVVAHFHSESP